MLAFIKSRTLAKTKINYKLHKVRISNSNMPRKASKPNKCSRCGDRHPPPTGAKCTRELMVEGCQPEALHTVMGESSEGTGQGNMNFTIPNPEPSSLEGEVCNMTGVMVQLLSRIEAQDQRISDIQNYIKNPSAQPTSALGGATASTLDNQLIHNLN
jgi:hypothetical protein